MKKLASFLTLILVLVSCILSGCGEGSGAIRVGTGPNTGVYYAFTNAMGSIIQRESGIQFSVVSTGGSVANINGIDDGDYQMATVQNDTIINAYNDLDKENFPNGAIKSFSVMGEVFGEVVHIVVRGDLKDKVKTLADLKGLRVSVGDAGSAVSQNAKELFAAYGMDIDKDIIKSNLPLGVAADTMKDGKLDAFFQTTGAPSPAVTELATSMDIFILSIEDSVMQNFIANHKIDGKYECYSVQSITHEQYDFIPEDKPVYSIGVSAVLIVSNDLDDETVYSMTKSLWEQKAEIAEAHSVGKAMDIKNAYKTVGNVPLHPGAERYYKEQGIIK